MRKDNKIVLNKSFMYIAYFSAESKEKKVNFFGLELESASGRVWKKAFQSTLKEQKMYDTAASSLVKGVLRWVAWTIFAVSVYGPEHLFNV